MTILTAEQRAILIARRDLSVSTLVTYGGEIDENNNVVATDDTTFQDGLRQGVVDAELFDDGIKALYDFYDDSVSGYEEERRELLGTVIINNLNDFYESENPDFDSSTSVTLGFQSVTIGGATTDEAIRRDGNGNFEFLKEDEIESLGLLGDSYLVDIITAGLLDDSTVRLDSSNGDINKPPTDPEPRTVRRLFPNSGETDVHRIDQFGPDPDTELFDVTGANVHMLSGARITDSEDFLARVEVATIRGATGTQQGAAMGTTTELNEFDVAFLDDNTPIAFFRIYQIEGNQGPSTGGVGTTIAYELDHIYTIGTARVYIIEGGSSTGATTDSMGVIVAGTGDGTESIAALVLDEPGFGITQNVIQGQIERLNKQRISFVNNTDPNKNMTALTNIDNRIAQLQETGVGNTDRANRAAARIAEIVGASRTGGRVADINARLLEADYGTTFYDGRYNTANQRANLNGGSLGQLRGKRNNLTAFRIPLEGETDLTLGSGIQLLKTLIDDINSNLDIDDLN